MVKCNILLNILRCIVNFFTMFSFETNIYTLIFSLKSNWASKWLEPLKMDAIFRVFTYFAKKIYSETYSPKLFMKLYIPDITKMCVMKHSYLIFGDASQLYLKAITP